MLNLSRNCSYCGAVAHGKIQPPYDNGSEIVTEARYQCPRCANLFAREIINREPKKKLDK
jgi:hypothetical protein